MRLMREMMTCFKSSYIDTDVQADLDATKGKALLVQEQGSSGNAESRDEMLQPPESSQDEGGIRLKFNCFRLDVDMENPTFFCWHGLW
jgi:hypothetical protein